MKPMSMLTTRELNIFIPTEQNAYSESAARLEEGGGGKPALQVHLEVIYA